MPLIPPQRLRAPAYGDRVARLRESLAFALYSLDLFIGALVAEEERHGLIHFTATLTLLWDLHSPSPSVTPSFLGHIVVLLF